MTIGDTRYTEHNAQRIIESAQPGERIIYYVGDLSYSANQSPGLAQYAHCFWLAAQRDGLVSVGKHKGKYKGGMPGPSYRGTNQGFLTQLRLSSLTKEYYFTKKWESEHKHNWRTDK